MMKQNRMKEKIFIHQKIPKLKIIYKQFQSLINITILIKIQKQTVIIKDNKLSKILSNQKPKPNKIMTELNK